MSKYLPSLNSISPLEVVLFLVFVLYLIFPIPTPYIIKPFINTNIGMAIVIVMTFYMLLYTTPILGILTVFVAYELLRRSSAGGVNRKVSLVKHTPSQPKKDQEMAKMNPPKELSLEEEMINKNSPVGKGGFADGYIESSFKPVHDKVLGGGSLV
jgi:hypothetical protein